MIGIGTSLAGIVTAFLVGITAKFLAVAAAISIIYIASRTGRLLLALIRT